LSKLTPVILSGGSGTRLWPLSRPEYPKQYLSLLGENTMLQNTILRLSGLSNLADPIIICNVEHRFLVAEQCHQIGLYNPIILLEPFGRNTAPAIAAASLYCIKESGDSPLLVLSADHVIQDVDVFHQAVNIGAEKVKNGKLVIFGIKPTNANTGYGYIKISKEFKDGVFEVEEFVEKPNQKTADFYLEQLNYLWNSGIFMFQASSVIDELKIHAPDIVVSANEAIKNATQDLDFIRLEKKAFESSPSDSIDCALIEKSNNVVVIQLDAKWNDIGTWESLYDVETKDSKGNVIKGDVMIQDTTHSYINSNHHMLAVIGVDNLIIVNTADATFITSKEKAQEVINIVSSLKTNGRSEASFNRKVYRPWGWYDSIESGEYFQVKRLHIKSNAKLSLQMHRMRAEHWVVIKGIATVTIDKKTFFLKKGESTYIASGMTHALENQAKEPLEIIEVQSGSYLGEDDIVRFEDIYGRAED
jgi:mannose-1-phosphate guanylyltransferase/mannose-6-phosphate isomerase